MKKQRIEHNSTLDALITVSKRLNSYESQFNMDSEIFYDNYQKGLVEDSSVFIDWANDYQHYFGLRLELERRLKHAA
jgi:hypothetical protein